MKVLDLFCGAGGVSMGWHRAGHDVTGVDNKPQPNYPFKFIQADALTVDLSDYDVIFASPPCQAYSTLRAIHKDNDYPDLVAAIRARLQTTGMPYVIENVAGAPLEDAVMLCGTMFGLRLFRHRYFESNLQIGQPEHIAHSLQGLSAPRTSRVPKNGEVWSIYGHFSGVAEGRAAMGIDWYMTQYETAQAIPPAYSEYIAAQVEHCLKHNLWKHEQLALF